LRLKINLQKIMPVTKSAQKALKVSIRRKEENDLVRAKIKGAIKGAKLSISRKEKDAAEKIQSLYKELDTAAKKNVIHKNRAARLKSRVTKAFNKANSGIESAAPVKKKGTKKVVKKTKKK
jgi:small subunit ribosomal protein S20